MDVLLLYPYLPHPGVAHGSGRLVEPLLRDWRARGVRVTLICGFRPHERGRLDATRDAVERLVAIECPLRADRGRIGRVFESLRTAWGEFRTRRPRHVVKLDRGAIRRAIRAERAATRFDVAQVELAGFASYVDELEGLPRVLIDHESGTASGDDLALDRRALKFVRGVYPWFDRIGVLSEEDGADLRVASLGREPFVRRPGITPPGESPYSVAGRDRVLFFGTAEHVPNLDAFAWLAEEVWPRIKALRPSATCRVATGKLPDRLAGALARAGIEHLGFVDDVINEVRRAAVVVSPLRKGRGVRIKNLETLAAGRPLVTTPLGARGLLIEPGVHAAIAPDAAGLAAETARLLADPAAAERLGRAARAHVVARFPHEAAAERNVAVWRELAAEAAAKVAPTPEPAR